MIHYDPSMHNHHSGGGKGLIVWVISMAVYGATELLGWVGDFDDGVVVALHLLSFISLCVGITAGAITIQDKLRVRKEKKGQKTAKL